MASASEEAIQPVMDLPTNPIPTSLEHGNPMSITIPQPPMGPVSSAAYLSHRRKRKEPIKRRASTSNIHDAGLALEKRRNKLGYHRTSVACGHCRRRKIRCLAAPDDVRCQQCIRLKKECNFYPVDQQPAPMERRPRAGSRPEGRASSSSDTSPAMHSGHMFNPLEPFNHFTNMPFPNHQEYPPGSASMNAGLVSPMTKVPENSRAFEFPPQQQQRTSWGSPFPDSAGYSSPGEGPPHSLWGRQTDSPVTPGAYSPHPSGPTSLSTSLSDSRSTFAPFAPSRQDPTWQRSMSYSMIENLPLNTYDTNQSFSYPTSGRRRASDMMRPPSLQTSATSSNTSISEAHLTPLSAPIQSPPSANWSMPAAPYSAFPGTMSGKYDGTWYSDAPLAKVTEEEFPPHIGSEPTIYTGIEGQ